MNIINDVFSSINLNTVFVLGACCMGVLVFGGIIGFVMQFLGFGLGIVFNFVEIFFHVISGGPLAWCGCLMVIFGCGACSLLTIAILSILPNCGTAQAVNLCRLFGS